MTELVSPVARVARFWEPGVWVAASRRAFGPVAEVVEAPGGGVLVENHPPHYLIALWRPRNDNGPFLRRWPSIVNIAASSEDDLLHEVLRQVPGGARVWLMHGDLDWALMAHIVMISEPGLEAFHYRELEHFVRAERERTLAAISSAYTTDPTGYRRFSETVRDDLE